MSGEIQFDHATGKTCYALLRDAVGKIWNGSAFETYQTAHLANYAIAATEQGATSGLYAATMPAVALGQYNIVAKERAGGAPAESDTTVAVGEIPWDGARAQPVLSDAYDVYHADVHYTKDLANLQDEYEARWFLNGAPILAGVSNPTIQVIKRSDGSDLIAESAMAQVGATEAFKYTATGVAVAPGGEDIEVVVRATINSATREFRRIVGRDSQ